MPSNFLQRFTKIDLEFKIALTFLWFNSCAVFL